MGSKPKYNPDDVERWVTVRGARIPIMKDGSFGVGVKDDDHSTEIVKTKEGYKLKVWEPAAGKKIIYSEWDSDKKDYVDRVFKTKKDAEIGKQSYDEAFGDDEDVSKTTSRNAKYDTSRATKNNSSATKNNSSSEKYSEFRKLYEKALKQEEKAEKIRKEDGWGIGNPRYDKANIIAHNTIYKLQQMYYKEIGYATKAPKELDDIMKYLYRHSDDFI